MATSRLLRILPLLCVPFAFAACGKQDASSAATAYESKDSAGVQLVHNAGPTGRPEKLLDAVESLRIGVSDENAVGERFFRVGTVTYDDSSRVYVGDASGTVRVFDATGKLVRTLGHKGRGPGEFEMISGVFLRGDTVEIADSYTSRMARFDANGRLVGEVRSRDDKSVVNPLARFNDGWIASYHVFNPQQRFGLVYDTFTVRRVAKLEDAFKMGGEWNTATTPSRAIRIPWQRIYHLKNGYAEVPLWEPEPSVAVDATGRVHVTNGAEYAINTFDLDGNLARRVTRDHTPVPLPDGIDDKYFAKVKAKYDTMKAPNSGETGPNGETVEPPNEMVRKDMPHSDALPTLGKLLVSRDGAMWVQRPDLSDEPLLLEWREEGRPETYWDVFDRDGRYRGTVKTPRNFLSRAVTSNSIIGISRNADDVESIVAYTIKY